VSGGVDLAGYGPGSCVARQVIGCDLTQYTRDQSELDEVASSICQDLLQLIIDYG